MQEGAGEGRLSSNIPGERRTVCLPEDHEERRWNVVHSVCVCAEFEFADGCIFLYNINFTSSWKR